MHTDTFSLEVAGVTIVKTTVDDYTLQLTWVDKAWGEWRALQTSEELAGITHSIQEKLNKVKALTQNKGKGKGATPE